MVAVLKSQQFKIDDTKGMQFILKIHLNWGHFFSQIKIIIKLKNINQVFERLEEIIYIKQTLFKMEEVTRNIIYWYIVCKSFEGSKKIALYMKTKYTLICRPF